MEYSFKQVLMKRDGYSEEDALLEIEHIKNRIFDGEDPEEILHNDYCLEPDYIMDLLY